MTRKNTDLTEALDMKGAIAHANTVLDAADAASAALQASGEELRTLAQLARELGVSKNALLAIVAPIETVRYDSRPCPYLYCAKDVREAFQSHLEGLRKR